jgi:hypothetical protein
MQQDCDGKVSVRFLTWSKNSFENYLILVFSANGPQLIAEAEADWIKKSVEKARSWKKKWGKMPSLTAKHLPYTVSRMSVRQSQLTLQD